MKGDHMSPCLIIKMVGYNMLKHINYGMIILPRQEKTMATKKKAPKKKAAKRAMPKKVAKKKTATKSTRSKAAKKSGKNKLGVKNSLVNNINARKKKGISRSKKKSKIKKKSYERMEDNWGKKR